MLELKRRSKEWMSYSFFAPCSRPRPVTFSMEVGNENQFMIITILIGLNESKAMIAPWLKTVKIYTMYMYIFRAQLLENKIC